MLGQIPRSSLAHFLLVSFCILQIVSSIELYRITDLTAEGELEIVARKEYNFMDRKGNKTIYDIKLMSPLLTNLRQEIRISLQWVWQQEYGVATERVLFYGTPQNELFSDYRIDYHPITDGGYIFDNWFAPQFSKDYYDIQPETSQAQTGQDRYTFLNIGDQEIFLQNQTAMFSVVVDRDEPMLEDNKLMINWGIFDSVGQNTGGEVYGSRDFYNYVIEFNFNDYFDRQLIYLLWNQIAWASLLGPFLAPIFQLFSSLYLITYVITQPSVVFFLFGGKSYFAFDQWFFDIGFRWQFLNIFALIVLYSVELAASIGSFYYLYAVRQLTLYSTDTALLLSVFGQDLQIVMQTSPVEWSIFSAIFVTGYISQIVWAFFVVAYLQFTLVY